MLKQKFILSYATRIIGQLISVIAGLIVARIVGPSVLGTVAYGLAFVSMYSFIAEFGFTTAHVKHISEGKDVGKCIGTYSIIRFTLVSIYVFFIIGYVLLKKYVSGQPFESPVHEKIIYIFLGMKVFDLLISIPQSTFNAKIEQAKKDIPILIRKILVSIIKVVVVLLGYGAIAIALSNLLAVILVIPLYIYLAKDLPWGKFDKELAKSYLKIAMPATLMIVAGTIYHQIDKILIQSLANTINSETGLKDASAQVGYYTAAFRFTGFITLIGLSVSSIFFPLFSKALKSFDFDYVKNKILQFENFSLNFLAPLVIILSIFSKPIVELLLGDEYLPSIEIMVVTNLAAFIIIMNHSYGNVITGGGKFKLAAIMQIINLAIFVSLSYFFLKNNLFETPGLGVAFSLLFSNLLYTILTRILAHKQVKIISPFTNAFKYIFGATLFFVSYNFYLEYYTHTIWFHGLFIVGFLGIYWGFGFLFNWISRESWDEALSILNIQALLRYIREEVTLKSTRKNKKIKK